MATHDQAREEAGRYVSKHGQFLREGVYAVRWPPHSASGLLLASDTGVLADKLAERMRKERPLPHRECGHSACGQHFIDTGETRCVKDEPL